MAKLTVGKLDNIIVQPVPRNELSSFMAWVHGDLSAQDLAIVRSEYEQRRRLVASPTPLEVLAGDQRVAGAYLSCLPGQLAMLGAVRALSAYESHGGMAIEKLIQQLRESMPNCQIQAAIGDHDHPVARMIAAAGLRPLTTIQQWWASPKLVIGPDAGNFGSNQLTFRPAYELSRRSFLRLFHETLEGTLDCPELNELRSPDQTLESFFMGRKLRQCPLWQAVWLNRRPVGCLMLAQHDHGVTELVYMGLAARARGMGLGNQLVQHAKKLSASLGASMLALAVDHRNSPAQKIYQQAGFQKHRSLQVYWL